MKKLIFLLTITLYTGVLSASATTIKLNTSIEKDSSRIAALDAYWQELSRTVKEGDYEGYKNTYHEDAIVIFAVGNNKSSMELSQALAGWKQGFIDTKEGKVKSGVDFRFSQRIGNETTAHETGIFHYWSKESSGKVLADSYVHFEMLFIKKNGKWLAMMEYQKTMASKEEWDAMK